MKLSGARPQVLEGSSLWLAAWLRLLVLVACAPEPELQRVQLTLRQLDSCSIEPPAQLELQALGDFPARRAQLQSQTGPTVFDEFPVDTREFLVRASAESMPWLGRGLLRPQVERMAVLLLPSERSCQLGDPFLNLRTGGVVAALPAGGFLLAGGHDTGGAVSASAFTLAAGASLIDEVAGGMLLRRSWASASLVGEAVLIAGGTSDLRAGAHDTFEIFDTRTARFLNARFDKLGKPRMQHGAAVLPSGSVLLVGGRAELEGAPLPSAELLDIASHRHQVLDDPGLTRARVAPEVLVLESGNVYVAAGRDQNGEVVDSIERFDPATRRFTPQLVGLPKYREVVVAALSGGRMAWFGCDSGTVQARCGLWLVFERSAALRAEPAQLEFDTLPALGLSELRMLAVDARRLLVTASDTADLATHRRAYLIDLNFGTARRIDASRVPSALVMMQNGQVAELDASGGSLRELVRPSPYASISGNLVDAELTQLALDAPAHWSFGDAGLQAVVVDARLDVPELRFRGLAIELELDGDGSLLLLDEAGASTQISVQGTVAQLQTCRHQLQAGAPLTVRLEGAHVTLSSNSGARACDVPVGPGSVHVALIADAGTQLRKLVLRRL